MDKVEILKAKMIEEISDKIDGYDGEIEKFQKLKRKEEEKIALLKTRI